MTRRRRIDIRSETRSALLHLLLFSIENYFFQIFCTNRWWDGWLVGRATCRIFGGKNTKGAAYNVNILYHMIRQKSLFSSFSAN